MRILLITLAIPFALLGCESAGKKTAYGAGIGAAAGAVAGAVIGHQSGNRGKGAAIGAAIGGLAGGTVGHRLDKQAAELKKVAETKRTENGIITKLKGDILFDSGRSAVSPTAQTNVQKISNIIAKYPENVVTIVGHTDATGKDATNQTLSKARAEAVRALMVSRGVPAPTVSAVGQGESQPVATNDTAAGRAQNRRVEIQIAVDESKVPKK